MKKEGRERGIKLLGLTNDQRANEAKGGEKGASVGSGKCKGKKVRKLSTGVEGTRAVLEGMAPGVAISTAQLTDAHKPNIYKGDYEPQSIVNVTCQQGW